MDELMISMTNRWKGLLSRLYLTLCVNFYLSFTESIFAMSLMIVSSKQVYFYMKIKHQTAFPLSCPEWQSSLCTWNQTQRCRATKGPARTSCFYNYDVLNGALEEKTFDRSLGRISTFTTFCCIRRGTTWTQPITEIEGTTFGPFGINRWEKCKRILQTWCISLHIM